MALYVVDAHRIHQPAVAGCDGASVYDGGDALAAYLADVSDAAAVDLPAVGALEAFAYGMAARTLGEGGVLYQLGVVYGLWCIPFTSKTPLVSVPVLSKTTTRTLLSVSR